MPHRFRLVAALAALSALAMPAAAHAAAPSHATAARTYDLSLGDSYAVGYQADVGRTTRHGFADQLLPLAKRRGYDYTLANFGCGGATTGSILHRKGATTGHWQQYALAGLRFFFLSYSLSPCIIPDTGR